MDNDKKKGRRHLIAESFFVSSLTRFAAWLYAAVLSSISGFALTSYHAITNGFRNAYLVKLLYKFWTRLKEKYIARVGHSVAKIYEQSFILTVLRRFCYSLLTMHVNNLGLGSFAYGFTVVIIQLLKLYAFHMEMGSPYKALLVGFIIMLIGIFMFFSKKSVAALLYESRTARFLLFDVLGLQMYGLAKAARVEPKRSFNGSLVIGLLLGGITAFTDAVHIPILALALLLFIITMYSPESTIILVFLTLPFLSTMQLVAIMCLVYVSFLLKLLCGRRVFRLHLIDLVALSFMVFIFFGGIYSVDGGSFQKMCVFVCFMMSYFVVKNTLRSPALVRRAVSALVASSTVVSLIGLYQNFFGTLSLKWLDTSVFTDISGRVTSTLGNPNVLGEYLILIFPLILARMVTAKKNNERFLYFVAAGLSCACLVFTWSRGAWLGFLVSLIVFFAISGKGFVTAGILSIPLLGTALYFAMDTAIVNRFTNLTDSSSSYRFNIWRGVIRMLDDIGLMGIGIGEGAFRMVYPAYSLSGIEAAPHSHNLFLQIIVETGIFSLIAFLAFLFLHGQCTLAFCKNAYSTSNKMISLGFFAGTLAFLVQGMTDYVWYNYRIFLLFWLMLGLGLAHINTAKFTEEESVPFQ